jgi:restriction system protein
MARSSRRRNESGFDILVEFPWQFSVFMSVVVFVGLKWVLPITVPANPILNSMAAGISGLAWLFSLFFLVAAAFAYASQKRALAKAGASELKPVARAPRAKRPPLSQVEMSNERVEPISVGWGAKEEQTLTGQPGEFATNTNPPNSGGHIDPSWGGKPTVWSLELIRDVEWKRFEDVCQKFYESKGIRSETTPLGPDGGIDIRLYQDDTGKATSVVQCKAWGAKFVGVQPVRELLGVMTHERIGKGFFMTCGRFSDDAKVVANNNRITLIDGQMLLMMILRLPAKAQKTLLEFATEGDYTTPTCPGCGLKMRSITGTTGRPDFWGCPDYPKCRHKLGMRRTA